MTTGRRYKITIRGRTYEVDVGDVSASPVTVIVDGVAYQVDLPARLPRPAQPSPSTPATQPPPPKPPQPTAVQLPAPAPTAPQPVSSAIPSSGAGDTVVRALMPGRVLRVNTAAGEMVARGTALVVLESMKMEQTIAAPRDGKVRSVLVKSGDSVQRGQTLIELE